jgi:hypothetical protein
MSRYVKHFAVVIASSLDLTFTGHTMQRGKRGAPHTDEAG